MTEEQLEQLGTIEERSYATIAITDTVEHEDGSATYTFDIDEASQKKVIELGLEFILTCAAYGLDIQYALEDIRWAGEQRELARKMEHEDD